MGDGLKKCKRAARPSSLVSKHAAKALDGVEKGIAEEGIPGEFAAKELRERTVSR